MEINNKFDLIIFRGVIEHVPDPKSYLNKAVRILEENGVIYITSTPNSNSVCCKIFEHNWNQHHPEAHLFHFNKSHFDDYLYGKKLINCDAKFFYEETPYCNLLDDIVNVAKAIKIKNSGVCPSFKSPPFYGSMMTLIYQKQS